MRVSIEDCKIDREPGWNQIRHMPTERCIGCKDDSVTDEELFEELCVEIKRLASKEELSTRDTFVYVKEYHGKHGEKE